MEEIYNIYLLAGPIDNQEQSDEINNSVREHNNEIGNLSQEDNHFHDEIPSGNGKTILFTFNF